MNRFALAPVLAALCTIVLLLLMQWLIRSDAVGLTEAMETRVLEFVRVIEEPPDPVKPTPQPPRPPEVPPVTLLPPPSATGGGPGLIPHAMPPLVGPTVTVTGGGIATPIVKIAPDYPRRAAARGIEGWVVVEFAITAAGTTERVRVVDADPEGMFERAAVAAVQRYRYRPAESGGRPVAIEGVAERIVFRLDDGE